VAADALVGAQKKPEENFRLYICLIPLGSWAGPAPLYHSPAREQADQDGNHCQHQQYMDKATYSLSESYVADQPQYD
jgi:hypothetical protein